ncbi:MAG TPA: LysM peptidoglycan-binding domain-containing M23 family metallopeptidase [Candidatus Polarisedimenticolia bacterium]|nr:LysM peptidoglycan-binding domain-containing M23 family metallopeptidase [Candidatus Polarisedimenticolia bacterium]
MRDWRRSGILAFFLAAAGGFSIIACGGRAAPRPETSPQPPPITQWERPARMSGATPAVRLDRKEKTDAGQESAPCGAGCEDTGAEGEGVRVSLDPGMTLYSLSKEYGVPVETIIEVNGIRNPSNIAAGTEIYVPTGSPAPPAVPPRPTARKARPKETEKPPEPDVVKDETVKQMSIVWPLEGLITGRFGQRGQHHHHDGIDIDGVRGEEVRAVASGIVVRSGSDGKYGKTVVIDHGGGVSTLYAHASRLLVSEGDEVEQGEAIAEVGATGNAHGTHLHFEVRRDGRPVDPLPYLKPEMVGARRSR